MINLSPEILEQERKNRLESSHEKQMILFQELIQKCKSVDETLFILKLLAKKKNQVKLSVRWLLNEIKNKHQLSSFPEQFPNENVEFFKIILSDVIEGKLFLEQERIDFVIYIKNIYEYYKMFEKALQLAYDVPIETFSTISLNAITNYQMDVLRLAIICGDKIQGEILFKKIKLKHVTKTNLGSDEKSREENEFRKKYLRLLRTDYFIMMKEFSNAANEFMQIVDDSNLSQNISEFNNFFELANQNFSNTQIVQIVNFLLIISEQTAENKTKLSEIKNNKYNSETIRELVDLFLSFDIIPKEETVHRLLPFCPQKISKSEIAHTIISHNFILLKKFFKNISFNDLEIILETPIENIFEYVDEDAKIDQRKGFIHFTSEDVFDVEQTLEKIDETVMFVMKEDLKRRIREEVKEKGV